MSAPSIENAGNGEKRMSLTIRHRPVRASGDDVRRSRKIDVWDGLAGIVPTARGRESLRPGMRRRRFDGVICIELGP